MITPFAASVIREGYAAVPKEVVEAIHSITSRRWEIVRLKLAYIRQYVFSGLILALGRAFGETVAVAMRFVADVGSAVDEAVSAYLRYAPAAEVLK